MALLCVRAVCCPAAAGFALKPLAEQHGVRGIQPLVVPWYRLQGQETAAQRSVAGPSASSLGSITALSQGQGDVCFNQVTRTCPGCKPLAWHGSPPPPRSQTGCRSESPRRCWSAGQWRGGAAFGMAPRHWAAENLTSLACAMPGRRHCRIAASPAAGNSLPACSHPPISLLGRVAARRTSMH